jgi:hypothetical protein
VPAQARRAENALAAEANNRLGRHLQPHGRFLRREKRVIAARPFIRWARHNTIHQRFAENRTPNERADGLHVVSVVVVHPRFPQLHDAPDRFRALRRKLLRSGRQPVAVAQRPFSFKEQSPATSSGPGNRSVHEPTIFDFIAKVSPVRRTGRVRAMNSRASAASRTR